MLGWQLLQIMVAVTNTGCALRRPLRRKNASKKTPLEFVGDEQYIQYCSLANYNLPADATPDGFNGTRKVTPSQAFPKCDLSNRQAIPAKRVSTGTWPEGSTWTRNPIPACNNVLGG